MADFANHSRFYTLEDRTNTANLAESKTPSVKRHDGFAKVPAVLAVMTAGTVR